jgi:tyrosine-specific transport protein
MNFSKIIGSVFLLMGTLIGGGVLAIPLVSSGASFLTASCLLTFMWLLMLLTGFLFLEVNLAFPSPETNFSSMAFRTLGRTGKTLTALSYLILLFALVAAYVSAGGSLLSELLQLMHVHLPIVISCLLFVLILGSVVFHGIKAVDYLNRFFFSLKGFLLVLVVSLLVPKIEYANLVSTSHSSKYLWAAAPIFLCAFGYHILIPVLSQYLNYEKKRICLALFFGSFFTWILYLFWLAVTMGVIPLTSFLELARQNGSVGEFVFLLSSFLQSKWLESAIHGFANITVTTCFLGVSLGLFNFLADFLKKEKNLSGRLQITLATFAPPLAVAIFYPKCFLIALGNAAICVAFSHVMLPAWMAFQLRKKKITTPYRVKGGNFLLASVFLIGLGLIILQVLVDFGLLPIFGK